jgi:hypothetical protein
LCMYQSGSHWKEFVKFHIENFNESLSIKSKPG